MSIFARKQEAQHGEVPLVVLHKDLIDVLKRQIRSSPKAETGGKFLGYIVAPGSEPPASPYGREISNTWRKLADRGHCLLLVGSISPGPRSERTATSLIPDGEFQTGVFRALESHEPSLEHLGTWHSHHPNGLPEFSPGDLAHYRSVIMDQNYEPDFFVAALCNDRSGLARGMVEIFGRHGGLQARLGTDRLIIGSGFPSLQPSVGQVERTIESKASSPACFPLESALAEYFTIKERRVDGDSVSWIIQSRSGSGFLGAVTQAREPDTHVATSLEVTTEGASLRYDGPISGDLKTLVAKLLDTAQKLDGAQRRAPSGNRDRLC